LSYLESAIALSMYSTADEQGVRTLKGEHVGHVRFFILVGPTLPARHYPNRRMLCGQLLCFRTSL